MKEVKIGDIIKTLRTTKGISQEGLADVCGVSMQAVSKWENNQSYPDITLLPVLSDYFQVTLDYLLTGENETARSSGTEDEHILKALQDCTSEDTLYIVQYRNGKILDRNYYNANIAIQQQTAIKIRFEEEYRNIPNGLHVEIWGNAAIEGDIYGNVSAGGSVSGAEIKGCVEAGGSIDCGDICGSVDAGATVNCGDIDGPVSAGNGVACGDISGNVSAGNYVSCGDIDGNVHAGGKVTCGDVSGDVKSNADIANADT